MALTQNGHWKSVNITSVTSAVFLPRTGEPSTGTRQTVLLSSAWLGEAPGLSSGFW